MVNRNGEIRVLPEVNLPRPESLGRLLKAFFLLWHDGGWLAKELWKYYQRLQGRHKKRYALDIGCYSYKKAKTQKSYPCVSPALIMNLVKAPQGPICQEIASLSRELLSKPYTNRGSWRGVGGAERCIGPVNSATRERQNTGGCLHRMTVRTGPEETHRQPEKLWTPPFSSG